MFNFLFSEFELKLVSGVGGRAFNHCEQIGVRKKRCMLHEWRPGRFTPEPLYSMNTNTPYIERKRKKKKKEENKKQLKRPTCEIGGKIRGKTFVIQLDKQKSTSKAWIESTYTCMATLWTLPSVGRKMDNSKRVPTSVGQCDEKIGWDTHHRLHNWTTAHSLPYSKLRCAVLSWRSPTTPCLETSPNQARGGS